MVGTPKTIEELVSLNALKLQGLRAVVLDEADLLLEAQTVTQSLMYF